MDVSIVSTSSRTQEAFWQERMSRVSKPGSYVIVIHEDWPGGAGNALGTLYAYQNARQKGIDLFGFDLLAEQQKGASVAMYHTAGKGTRLFPLTGSEANNKSAVKLPSPTLKTLLEAVIEQSASFAPHRKGYLSVYWGDQIFVPSIFKRPRSHISVMAKVTSPFSESQWNSEGIEHYGLLVADASGRMQQLDKLDFSTWQQLVSSGKVTVEQGVGLSLGSFCLSTAITVALLEEFEDELIKKSCAMDVEPHIWMPTTLDRETYSSLMRKKGWALDDVERQYSRMQAFKKRFVAAYPEEMFFDRLDLGNDCYWWDYGNIDCFYRNCLKLNANTPEGQCMRAHFHVEKTHFHLNVDDSSILINCDIKSGRIRNSVLANVVATNVDIEDSVIINSRASSFSARDSLIYQVSEEGDLSLDSRTICTEASPKGDVIRMYSQLGRDGKKDWAICLPSNPLSYEELHRMNQEF